MKRRLVQHDGTSHVRDIFLWGCQMTVSTVITNCSWSEKYCALEATILLAVLQADLQHAIMLCAVVYPAWHLSILRLLVIHSKLLEKPVYRTVGFDAPNFYLPSILTFILKYFCLKSPLCKFTFIFHFCLVRAPDICSPFATWKLVRTWCTSYFLFLFVACGQFVGAMVFLQGPVCAFHFMG
jgi:hypothetical protein